jgi:hypothetical protein
MFNLGARMGSFLSTIEKELDTEFDTRGLGYGESFPLGDLPLLTQSHSGIYFETDHHRAGFWKNVLLFYP